MNSKYHSKMGLVGLIASAMLMLLIPKAMRGPFWAFGIFDQGPTMSILLQFFLKFLT